LDRSPFWGKGYGTEAVRALVGYGFNQLKLNRIFASHYANNPASGKILQKLGMQYEGRLSKHYCKWGEYVDAELYGVLASNYRA
jgi:ribosomal-protein-alanine N-acetyltransferase